MKRPARSAVKVSASVVDVAPHVRRAVAIARAGRTAIGSASAEFATLGWHLRWRDQQGSMTGCPEWEEFEDGEVVAYLPRVEVEPDHRGAGVGRRVMVALLDALDAEGVDATWLSVAPLDEDTEREGLERFYSSLGFVRMGVAGEDEDASSLSMLRRRPAERRANPTGGLGPPVELPDDCREPKDMIAEAVRRGATPRRIALGLASVAQMLVQRLDAARQLTDDRVEGTVDRAIAWCLGAGEPDEFSIAVSGATQIAYAAPWGPPRFVYVAVKELLTEGWTWSVAGANEATWMRSGDFAAALAHARQALTSLGDRYEEAWAIVTETFAGALAGAAERRSNPPQADDAPVRVPESARGYREMLLYAEAQGAGRRRIAWAILAVCDMLLARLEAARLLDDDRPEEAVAAVRRWCLGDGDSADVERAAGLIWTAARDAKDTKGAVVSRALMGVDYLLGDVFVNQMTGQAPREATAFADAMHYAANGLHTLGEPRDAARAIVAETFAAGLAEPMTERRANPRDDDRAYNPGDAPVRLSESSRKLSEMLREADEAGASDRRLGMGLVAVCELLLAKLDEARLLDDDRAESMVATFARWCARETDQEELDAVLRAWKVADAYRGRRAARNTYLFVRSAAQWALTFGRPDPSRDRLPYSRAWAFGDVMKDAGNALHAIGAGAYGYAEAVAEVKEAFAVGLARPRERRENPPRPPTRSPRSDAPVALMDDELFPDQLLRAAREAGASKARLLWALATVGQHLVDRLERDRVLEDDVPEHAMAAIRRWCLRQGTSRDLAEASAEMRAVVSRATGENGYWRRGGKWGRVSSVYSALELLCGLALELVRGRRSEQNEWEVFRSVANAFYEAGDLPNGGTGMAAAYGDLRAPIWRLAAVLRHGLASPMIERASNPSVRAKRARGRH